MATVTPRGFTGQEHLDTTGLVHMNGRVYDAKIGRFLSADPHLQDETNLQAYNRYSYVLNNPLSYTDPSGFFFKKLFNAFKSVFKAVTSVTTFVLKNALREVGKLSAKVPGLSVAIQGAACFYGGPAGCAAAAALLTYASGGSLKDAAIAAAFAYGAANVWQTVGAGLADFTAAQGLGVAEGALLKGAVHGTVGGALSAAQGGSFHEGFIANGAAGLSTPLIFGTIGTGLGIEDIAARTAAASVVGGAAAELAGGNFENGATTAAFAWVFNTEGSVIIESGWGEAFDKERWQRIHVINEGDRHYRSIYFDAGERIAIAPSSGAPHWNDNFVIYVMAVPVDGIGGPLSSSIVSPEWYIPIKVTAGPTGHGIANYYVFRGSTSSAYNRWRISYPYQQSGNSNSQHTAIDIYVPKGGAHGGINRWVREHSPF
ncbi:MAG: RHS repeat-associated core domain-containing protein [Rhodovibrionaceae bacterium]